MARQRLAAGQPELDPAWTWRRCRPAAVAGKVAAKHNRFIKLTGATKSVNRQLEAKARALAGLKGYVTNLPDLTAEFVIDAYHRLFQPGLSQEAAGDGQHLGPGHEFMYR